jgi:ComF family protein
MSGAFEWVWGRCAERLPVAPLAPAQALVARSIHSALELGRAVARGALADLLDALYPPRCALCPAAGGDGPWCDEHRLPEAPEGERCERCAAQLPAALAGERVCAACRRRSPRIARTLVLADYRAQPIRPWILAFKHGGRTDLAVPLAAALAAHVARTLPWPEDGVARLLCPIPLHPWRRLERGYDQALLLAQALAAELDTPCEALLARSRATAVQGAAGARSRASNVRGAFTLRSDGLRSSVAGRRATRIRERIARFDEIWLVDDVVTSGATLREAARALRRAGARRVCALALARADGAAHDADELPLGFVHEADA